MRILLVGGDDVAARIPLMNALRKFGHEALAAGTGDGSAFERAGLKFLHYPHWRSRSPARSLAALAKRVREVGPDVVHGFDTVPGLLVSSLGRSRQPIRTSRTVTGLGWSFSTTDATGPMLRQGYGITQRALARHADCTVFQNPEDLQLFVEQGWIPASRARLIAGSGVDVARFRLDYTPTERTHTRAELGVTGRRVVLMVSRLIGLKGVDTFIDCAKELAETWTGEPVDFLLVGPAEPSKRGVQAHDQDLGEVRFRWLGSRDDVESILSVTDVFCLPTRYREGIPRVLLEAGALGRALVATDVPGCRSVVQHGRTGLLVPPGSAPDLARAVSLLLQQPELAAALGQSAHDLITSEFSLEAVARQYHELFEQLRGS